jgi:hypothetical protein
MSKSILGYRMSGDMRPLYTGRGNAMVGGAWYDDLYSGFKSVVTPILDVAKKTGAISKIAGAFGQPEIAGVASALGYGKKRRKQTGGRRKRSKASKMIMKA